MIIHWSQLRQMLDINNRFTDITVVNDQHEY